ncbi:MAG: hypothetical protein ACFFFK_12910 [Candidatus Thorarchaeota archaeon]
MSSGLNIQTFNVISRKTCVDGFPYYYPVTNIEEALTMKKCQICGAILDSNENILSDSKEGSYCIFCLDKTGKPPDANHIRANIKNFWLKRDAEENNTSEDGG